MASNPFRNGCNLNITMKSSITFNLTYFQYLVLGKIFYTIIQECLLESRKDVAKHWSTFHLYVTSWDANLTQDRIVDIFLVPKISAIFSDRRASLRASKQYPSLLHRLISTKYPLEINNKEATPRHLLFIFHNPALEKSLVKLKCFTQMIIHI